MTSAPTPHAADVASLATLTERAAETRIAMLIGTGGLAVSWAFLVASGRLAHLPIALGPANLIFAGLIALDLATATSARTWAEWRWTPYMLPTLRAVVLTVLLPYIGGLRMGIFFITDAFVIALHRRAAPGLRRPRLPPARHDAPAVLSRLEADRELRTIPVLVLSQAHWEEDEAAARAAGAAHFRIKPSRVRPLREAVVTFWKEHVDGGIGPADRG